MRTATIVIMLLVCTVARAQSDAAPSPSPSPSPSPEVTLTADQVSDSIPVKPATGPDPTRPPPAAAPVDGFESYPEVDAQGRVRGPALPACTDERHNGAPRGPVVIGFNLADLGTGRHACPRSEVTLGERGGAIIDTPDFYGALAADTQLAGSYAVSPRLEAFAMFEVLSWRYAQNASLKGSVLGLGQLSGGVSYALGGHGNWMAAPFARVMLPLTTLNPHAASLGGELGVLVEYHRLRWAVVHGYVSGDFTAMLSAAPASVRGGVAATLGIELVPVRWFALVVDLQTHFGGRDALDYIAPAGALRFRVGRLSIDLSATAPLAGADRRLALGALRLGIVF